MAKRPVRAKTADEGAPEAAPPSGVPEPEAGAARPVATAGQYLTFFIGGEEYAAEILQSREIIEFDEPTRVPTTPPWIRGVINLRGSVVPVVDLAVKLGLPDTEVTQRTCVVIVDVHLEQESTVMGVMVDSVSQVIDLAEEEIESAPRFGTRVHPDCLLGIGKPDGRFVLLLDVDRVLTVEELMAEPILEAALHQDGGNARGTDRSTPESAPASRRKKGHERAGPEPSP